MGHVTIASLAVGMIAMAGIMLGTGLNWVLLAVLVLLLVCLVLFPTLTVHVDAEAVNVRFGPGLIGRTIPTARIRSCQPVRNRWYYGWGIRLYPGGWMFNVSGLRAVELELENGRRFRIGTDQPDELAAAIRAAIAGR